MAEWDFGDDYLARIRTALEDNRFFDLPAEISPSMSQLHQPDLSIEVTLGARKHKVRLYDPNQMKGDVRVKRFLTLWTALYGQLPLKPSW
jgi:hypothetical protein